MVSVLRLVRFIVHLQILQKQIGHVLHLLSVSVTIKKKWCESLYNFGMRQYFGGGPFTKWIESGLGDKKNSRASWLDRGFYYRNSKYNNLK